MSIAVIPDALRRARRELETVAGYRLLQDWQWLKSIHRWALRFRLHRPAPDSSPVPSDTDWVVLVANGYPWGSIKVYPAKENGITDTFPHQAWNEEGVPDLPHRTGDLCLGVMTQDWQIRMGRSEPHTVDERLRWHAERTAEWVDRAIRQELFRPGDDWEPPARRWNGSGTYIVVGRRGSELHDAARKAHGLVELVLPDPSHRLLFADRFFSATDAALRAASELGPGIPVGKTEWGAFLNDATTVVRAIWVKMEQVPALPYWRLPGTWGELRACYQRSNSTSLDGQIADVLRRANLEPNQVAHLLLGYPAPARFGETPQRLQWEACSMDGFSISSAALSPPDSKKLQWAVVYSAHDLMRRVRGQLSASLCDSSALLIGAGALGSTIAELLVRGGLKDLCIIDGEVFGLGNLVRHTLTAVDVGWNKAEAVADRLNASSLDAKVTALQKKLSSLTLPELMAREPRIVLDTTGSDQVLSELAGWSRPTLFLSISLGLYARRIYGYAAYAEGFPVEDFHSQLQPWLQLDQEETRELPRPAAEGVGCWSPVFPARMDDVCLLAAAALKWIEEISASPPTEPVLAVFQQDSDREHFVGMKRVK